MQSGCLSSIGEHALQSERARCIFLLAQAHFFSCYEAPRCTRGYATEGNKPNWRAVLSSRSPDGESREGRLSRGLVLTVWGSWTRAGGQYGSEASLRRAFRGARIV
jgi:hypothetical protein